MNRLNEIVKEMLEKHKGGKKFFDNLDPALQDKSIIKELWYKIPHGVIITTGSFGRFLSNWMNYNRISRPVYIVDGGIRDGKPVTDLSAFKMELFATQYVIVDDSYYSGRTVRDIRTHLDELGGIYNGTCVIYDGSFREYSDVISLYRYYTKGVKYES